MQTLNSTQLRDLLKSPDAYATSLLILFIDRYGTEGMGWAPETIRLQVADDFGVELPKLNFDRLMAAIAVVTSDGFFKSLTQFTTLCCILAGDDFDPTQVSLPDVVESAWGVTEAMLLHPPDFTEDPEPFCDDIRHFLAAILKNEGFVKPPDVLRIAIDADLSDAVRSDYGDDPELFSAIYTNQTEKTNQVLDTLKENIQDLMTQIVALPLENGKTDDLANRIRQGIGRIINKDKY